jgi:hypothetical protein
MMLPFYIYCYLSGEESKGKEMTATVILNEGRKDGDDGYGRSSFVSGLCRPPPLQFFDEIFRETDRQTD